MPVAQEVISIFSALAPIPNTNTQSTETAADFDHLLLFFALTLGSLTDVTLKPQLSFDGNAWFDVYDANGTLISWTFVASFSDCRLLGAPQNTTRMTPLVLGAELWRFDVISTGATAGSSLTLDGVPFNIGMAREF